MGKRSTTWHAVLLLTTGFGIVACGLDSSVSPPNVSLPPSNGGATLTGGGAMAGTEADSEVTEFGDTPSGANVAGTPKKGEFAAGGDRGGTDSGGAPAWGAGGIGGATVHRGGAAGAGGLGGRSQMASSVAQAGAGGKSGALGKAGAAGAPPVEPASGVGNSVPMIFFSEYIEGSSSNKALEISAGARSLLDGCKVATYFNGNGTPSVVASLSGVLEAGRVLTLCTSSLQGVLGTVCDQVGRLTFNGNDAVALACNGTLLDVIGQIGVDPGTAWGVGTVTTLDHTLRRKCSVTHGDDSGLNAFDPSLEWEAFPADTWSGLGQRGC